MTVVKVNPKVFKHDAQGAGFEPDTHVDLGIDFKRLISEEANSYILEGIRGTGKTHILKMIINEIKGSFIDLKVIPAYITIASSPQITKEDPKYFRIFLYVSIIRSVCKFIEENGKDIAPDDDKGLIMRLRKLFNMEGDNYDIEENINYILTIANSIIGDLFDNPDKIVSRVNRKNDAQLGGKIGTEQLGVSAEKKQSNEKEEVKEYTTIKLSDIYGVDILISFLRLVKKLLKLNYVYVFLDECSESTKAMQVEIFRLCKQIRGCCSDCQDLSKPDVAFIAAVYPPQGTYYPATTRNDDFNFQPGHDCTIEYLEIDELNEEFESFFKQLTGNRLKLNNGGPYTIEEVFENEEAVLIAAYCSGGVPRRFLEILKQAYNQLVRDFGAKTTDKPKKIDSSYIISAVGQVVEGPALLNDGKLTNDDSIILEKIIKKFAQRNKTVETKNKDLKEEERTPVTIYFTTAARSAGEIANLISVGIVHDKKRTRSRKSSAASWKGSGILCSLDIGVALHRGVISRTPARLLEICQSDIIKASYRGFTYVLDMPLEEESLDLEFEETKDYVKFLEVRLLDLDRALMEKKIPEGPYQMMVERTQKMLDAAVKRLQKIKEKIKEKRPVTTIPQFDSSTNVE